MDKERLRLLLLIAIDIIKTELYYNSDDAYKAYLKENLGLTDAEIDELELFEKNI